MRERGQTAEKVTGPQLATDSLTIDLVGWLQMDAEIKRLGGSNEEAAES